MARPVWHVAAANSALSAGNQREVSIAVDPSDPSRVFVIAIPTTPSGDENGFLAAMTEDGGANWNPMKVAEGPNMDIPQGSFDPWVAFSDEGKLFITYFKDVGVDETQQFGIPAGANPAIVAMWDEINGQFLFLEALPDNTASPIDKPTMAVGPLDATSGREALWVLYRDGDRDAVIAAGAELDANGNPVLIDCPDASNQRYFCNEQIVAFDDATSFPTFPLVFPGDIAIGPSGEVSVSFIRLEDTDSAVEFHVSIDPDGLDDAQGFPAQSAASRIYGTTLSLPLSGLPTQPNKAPFINANLAWDRAGERLYLVTVDEVGDGTNETDIALFTSTTGEPGSWVGSGVDPVTGELEPIRVNNDDTNGAPAVAEDIRSQFIPNVAVDQVTGLVAVAWQDPRRDDGSGNEDQRDNMPNTESEAYFGATYDVLQGIGQTAAARSLSIAPTNDLSHLDYLGVAIPTALRG